MYDTSPGATVLLCVFPALTGRMTESDLGNNKKFESKKAKASNEPVRADSKRDKGEIERCFNSSRQRQAHSRFTLLDSSLV